MPDRDQMIRDMIYDAAKPLDPLKYRTLRYVLNVETEVAAGGTGANQLSINDNPFMWTKTTCGLKVAGTRDTQDNDFLVRLRDTNRYYDSDFHRPDLAYGDPRTGVVIPNDVPIFLDSNATITGEVINLIGRQGESFNVQFILHGFERWAR